MSSTTQVTTWPPGTCFENANQFRPLGPVFNSLTEAHDCSARITLALAAFDVLVQRGWTLYRDGGGWWIACGSMDKEGNFNEPIIKAKDGSVCWFTGLRSDPFTALVDADNYCRGL